MAFVVDNSVVIAWLTERQATAYTRRLSTRAEREAMHAPAVWPFEFVNVLWVMQQRRILRADQADMLMGKARRLGIVVDAEPVAPSALLDWTRRTKLAAYDASYLELAARRGWPLATRDTLQQRAAQRVGVALA